MGVSIRRPITSNPVINSFGDLEELLRVADSLHDKCRDLVDTLWRRKLAMVTALVAYAIAIVWLFANGYIQNLNQYLVIALMVVSAVSIIGYWFPLLNHTKHELARDQRTLNELVDLLRAIEPHLANGSTLSFVEQATLRIRVARFDIGPESDSLRSPVSPKPASTLEPQPVPVHDHREAEQPSHT